MLLCLRRYCFLEHKKKSRKNNNNNNNNKENKEEKEKNNELVLYINKTIANIK